MEESELPENRGLALFAKVLFAATFLLVVAGGLVTSTDSGLSVPDWPTTYGWNMFTFPLSKWVGNIRFEHSHRLIASTVGFLTILLTVWVWRRDRRRGVKILAASALAAVVLQGILGGLTVRYLLPTPVSVAHACLAQTFLCMTMALALLTSRGWLRGALPLGDSNGRRARGWAIAAFAAIYVQLVLGAWMRHSHAGLAIPDFPGSFGGIVPDHWSSKIALAFAHRAWAAATAAAVITASALARKSPSGSLPRRPAKILLALLPLQVALGGLSVLTAKAVPVTVAHVAVGALLLAAAAWLAIAVHAAPAVEISSAAAGETAYPAASPAAGRA
jgi:heme a synthase